MQTTNNKQISYKKIFLKIHLYSLLPLLLNFLSSYIFTITLVSSIAATLKILVILSAITLFFYYRKPFKKRALYFGFFLFSPFISVACWLIDGIMGAVVATILLGWVIPKNEIKEQDNIVIYKKFNGVLGGCCNYEIVQRTFIFDKHLANFRGDESIDFEKVKIKLQDDKLYLEYTVEDYENERTVIEDTIINLKSLTKL